MKAFRDRNPYAIGIGSILVIGAFVGVAFMVGVLHLLERAYTVKAVFTDAAGIRPGADVRVAGVKAGRVTGIQADRLHGHVIITLHVNDGVHLGPDTRAEVALETLLGTKFVRLSGPVTRPYLEQQPASARVIPVDRTKTPFDIFELAKVGTRTIEATDTAKLNQLIRDLADITQGKQQQVHDLIDGIAKLSTALGDRDAQLGQLLDRFDQLSKTLADKDQTLVGLIDQSQGVLDLVQRRHADIAQDLSSTANLAQQLAGVIGTNKGLINSILQVLHPTLDIVDRRAANIDRTLSWIGAGALGLAKATTHGPWEDIYVRSVGPDVVAVLGDVIRQTTPAGARR